MRLATAVAAVAVAVVGCGPAARPAPAPPPPAPAPPPPRVDGAWHWEHEATADGVHRVETETWHLFGRDDGNAVTGYYDRRVAFLSVDGTPFSCSQLPHYVLRTRYQVEGTLRDGAIELTETAHETAPSPCDNGQRGRARYTGTVAGDRLELTWGTGKQVLARTGDAVPAPPLAEPPGPVTGAWQWQTTTALRDEVEEWTLTEGDDGAITGGYQRTVTVRAEDGEPLACSGETSFSQVETYTVRGTRRGTAVEIVELTADVTPSPCDVHRGERLLDSARGAVWPKSLELIWRGERRQVLHRPEP